MQGPQHSVVESKHCARKSRRAVLSDEVLHGLQPPRALQPELRRAVRLVLLDTLLTKFFLFEPVSDSSPELAKNPLGWCVPICTAASTPAILKNSPCVESVGSDTPRFCAPRSHVTQEDQPAQANAFA